MPKMIYIKWKDHFSLGDTWSSTEGYKSNKDYMTIESIGYLMHESKETFFIALNYCQENETSADSMAILKSCIIKKKFIKL